MRPEPPSDTSTPRMIWPSCKSAPRRVKSWSPPDRGYFFTVIQNPGHQRRNLSPFCISDLINQNTSLWVSLDWWYMRDYNQVKMYITLLCLSIPLWWDTNTLSNLKYLFYNYFSVSLDYYYLWLVTNACTAVASGHRHFRHYIPLCCYHVTFLKAIFYTELNILLKKKKVK